MVLELDATEPGTPPHGRSTGRSSATRQLVLRTAEELFATHGIDAVSLRQIAVAAGQRNTGVVQYHFGGKAGVLLAILEERVGVVNERRLTLITKLRAEGRLDEPRAAVEAFVLPLADELSTDNHYLGFSARLLHYPAGSSPYLDLDPALRLSTKRNDALFRRHLGHVSPRVRANRIRFIIGATVSALADRQLGERAGTPTLPSTDLFLADLLDGATGVLTAPTSKETADLLRTRRRT